MDKALLERCPVCDRPGPVLDRVIKRMPSEDIRGCAEEVGGCLTRIWWEHLEANKP